MTKINVRVVPGSSKEKVEYNEEQKLLRVWTTAPPEGGKANKSVISQIAGYLGLKEREVRLVVGAGGRNKIIEVDADIKIDDLTKKPKLF